MAICRCRTRHWMDVMTTMTQTAPFWDRLAERYAAQPVKDQDSYEKTLNRVRAHLTPQDNVLEIGCGTGSTALTLSTAAGHIHATDISSGMIEIANRKAAAAGITNVTFGQAEADEQQAPGTYDAVMAFNLLHLLRDPAETTRLAREALRPGGLFISKTPCLGGKKWLYGPIIGAMRLIGKAPFVKMLRVQELEDLITDAGFEVIETGTFPANPPCRFVVARKL